ncbi:hypothetical protein [Proteiniclasticum sp.]|uniref:hypothetical protein n=1 Tax=Proteiniclasticum sp. TaxID=2053595 RepID=UPI00289EFDDE|nr:hypothetical protein [Proteiniclasticum sp.]
MWRKYKLNIIALLIVILARILIVPAILPREFGAYPRIMSYQIRRDYPMYEFVNLKNLNTASDRSGYTIETLLSLDLLTHNNLDIEKAKAGIDRELEYLNVPADFRSDLLVLRLDEIYETYNRPVRLISILYEVTLIIIISTLFYYLLYVLNYRRNQENLKHIAAGNKIK